MPPFAPQPSQLHSMGIGSLGGGVGSGGGGPAAAGLLDDDMMDPLFDEDWLHEHNLDILFDLFEEEIENKVADANNGSSTIFSTSPVTSYFFGTSPTLASAIDLYDLLYSDNQHNNNLSETQHQQNNLQHTTNTTNNNSSPNLINVSTSSSSISSASSIAQCNNNQANTSTSNKIETNNTFNINNHKHASNAVDKFGSHKHKHQAGAGAAATQQNMDESKSQTTNSITNAMRIKRGFKRGQCEGISLLAKPFNSTGAKIGASNSTCSSNDVKSEGTCSNSSSGSSKSSINTNNNSDKTSAKITKFKKSIMGNINNDNGRVSASIDIINSKQNHRKNRDRHLYHYHHHVHYITGCSIIREHAYALRGH